MGKLLIVCAYTVYALVENNIEAGVELVLNLLNHHLDLIIMNSKLLWCIYLHQHWAKLFGRRIFIIICLIINQSSHAWQATLWFWYAVHSSCICILLDVAVKLAAHYCKNPQHNTTFLHYSRNLQFIMHFG